MGTPEHEPSETCDACMAGWRSYLQDLSPYDIRAFGRWALATRDLVARGEASAVPAGYTADMLNGVAIAVAEVLEESERCRQTRADLEMYVAGCRPVGSPERPGE